MSHDEFVSKWKAGMLEITVNRSMALQVVGSPLMPAPMRAAHTFWSWIWILSMPAAFVVGWMYSWWLCPIMLLFLTPIISSATKTSAMQFMIDHAVESSEFFAWACDNSLLSIREKAIAGGAMKA